MHSLLGRCVALSIIGTSLIFGASNVWATSPETVGSTTTTTTTSPPASSTTTTTAAPSTTTTTPTTTTTTPSAPLVVGLSPSPAPPARGTQAQVTETLPPPPTTTTIANGLPANSGTGRRAVYSKSKQRVWTVEADGTVSQTHAVSGRLTWDQPLPGTYSVFSRSGYTCNIKNPAICWRYMIRFAKGSDGDNIGFHEIPINTTTGRAVQSVEQLGAALSGGCVRQSTVDAQYMWNWAPVGTKVVVLP